MNVTGYIHTYFQILNYSFKPDLFLQEWIDSKQHMEFFSGFSRFFLGCPGLEIETLGTRKWWSASPEPDPARREAEDMEGSRKPT